MTGSYCGFLLNHEIFSYKSTTGTLQEGSHVGTGWICEHLYVPEGYRYGYRFGTGESVEKKEQFQALHANMNELIVFQDIARYRFW